MVATRRELVVARVLVVVCLTPFAVTWVVLRNEVGFAYVMCVGRSFAWHEALAAETVSAEMAVAVTVLAMIHALVGSVVELDGMEMTVVAEMAVAAIVVVMMRQGQSWVYSR